MQTLGRQSLANDVTAPGVVAGVPRPELNRLVNTAACGRKICAKHLRIERIQFGICLFVIADDEAAYQRKHRQREGYRFHSHTKSSAPEQISADNAATKT